MKIKTVAVLGAGVGCYQDSVHMKHISNGLRQELEAIAAAKGIDISKADASSSHGSAVPPSARYSTLQDLDAGRHTEIDMFSGVLIRMGKEHDKWFCGKTGKSIMIPRHGSKEIPTGTVNRILNDTGIK